jgi:uncharacterized membrane protein YfcA
MAWALCAGIGLLSGFLAGLLGVGGGTVIVPALILAAQALGIGADDAVQVAMATSLAIVIPTSISSARAHASYGAIDWRAFGRLAPGIAAGALGGTLAAATLGRALGGRLALVAFIVFALCACVRLLTRRAAPMQAALPAALPGLPGLIGRSVVIGLVSALAGVGGGLLSVPLLARHIPIKRAIGTAAALGLPLAAAGLAGYLLDGRGARCTPGCIGAVFLPAVLGVSLTAIVTAPLGAALARRWPVRRLERVFAALLLLVSTDLAADLLR